MCRRIRYGKMTTLFRHFDARPIKPYPRWGALQANRDFFWQKKETQEIWVSGQTCCCTTGIAVSAFIQVHSDSNRWWVLPSSSSFCSGNPLVSSDPFSNNSSCHDVHCKKIFDHIFSIFRPKHTLVFLITDRVPNNHPRHQNSVFSWAMANSTRVLFRMKSRPWDQNLSFLNPGVWNWEGIKGKCSKQSTRAVIRKTGVFSK